MGSQPENSTVDQAQGLARPMAAAMDKMAQQKVLVGFIMRAVLAATLVAAFGLYACAERPAPPPIAAAPPPKLPTVVPAPPPVAVGDNWQDWPATPGDWAYRQDPRGSVALFGALGGDAQFLVRCDTRAGRIYASRSGNFPAGETGRMTIRASTGLQTYPVANTDSASAYVAAEIIPADRHLDAIAFSRGKFLVSVKGATDLVIPAWPEITRVIEDCRS